MLKKVLFIVFCGVAALLYALYIYPTHPYLVFGLLFLCWGCYRLMLRAEKLFGNKEKEISVSNSEKL
jgi:hypothetical protein